MTAADDNDEWPPPFEVLPPRRVPASILKSLMDYARRTWRNDGAEGETVHRLCDELEHANRSEARLSPPSLLQLKEGMGFRYVLSIDHARSGREDLSAAMILVRDERGEMRVEMVTMLDRNDSRGALPQHYALTKGWQCPACFVFCGEEKEPMLECRQCKTSRPGP